jgi:hypothetical protein
MVTHKIRFFSFNLAVIICVVDGITAPAGNLIQNGSFESPIEPGTGIYHPQKM